MQKKERFWGMKQTNKQTTREIESDIIYPHRISAMSILVKSGAPPTMTMLLSGNITTAHSFRGDGMPWMGDHTLSDWSYIQIHSAGAALADCVTCSPPNARSWSPLQSAVIFVNGQSCSCVQMEREDSDARLERIEKRWQDESILRAGADWTTWVHDDFPTPPTR